MYSEHRNRKSMNDSCSESEEEKYVSVVTTQSVREASGEVDSLCASWRQMTAWDTTCKDPCWDSSDPWLLPPLEET